MLLSPKPGIIYGPVTSRRLGFSLGINLLPPAIKSWLAVACLVANAPPRFACYCGQLA
jgi:hypothetical protein